MNILKNTVFAFGLASMGLCGVCCSCSEKPAANGGKQETPSEIDRTVFAKGADISWVTQMESEGMKFYNAEGQERECTELMKELGFNSIRLRVWVNPENGWNSKEDVLVKALRAKKLGMRIMIDFHYSDTWADPGSQTPPAAWASYDIDQLKQAVAGHTSEVLSLLKEHDIDVEWVQVGNETRTGMLWPLGGYKENGGKNYAGLTNAGCDAAKKVYPDSKVIVHLDCGHNLWLYTELFNVLDANGGKYDMIGMSLYPCWWNNETGSFSTDWKTPTDQCLKNIVTVAEKYGKDVMICEVGMPVCYPSLGKEMLSWLLEKAKASGHCEGVFYWEPEAPDGYNGGYGLGAFADGKPTAALDPFKY